MSACIGRWGTTRVTRALGSLSFRWSPLDLDLPSFGARSHKRPLGERQGTALHETAQHACAAFWFKVEEASRLGQRQLQAGHLAVLRADANVEVDFVMGGERIRCLHDVSLGKSCASARRRVERHPARWIAPHL